MSARPAKRRSNERRDAPTNSSNGTQGERDVARKVRCPNCKHRLVPLPPGFPLFDVQCSACVFRAQVKTNRTRPRGEIFGAGFRVLDHAMRSGQLIPPLIVNFSWIERGKPRQQILFYPFLTRDHLRKRVRGTHSSHAGYHEFNYIRLSDPRTPRVVLYAR